MTEFSNIAWEDAFDKFGYDGGDGLIGTFEVERVLIDSGFEVECAQWGLHNMLIVSICKNGAELIPLDDPEIALGYDEARSYLPQSIVDLLDRAFPHDGP